jgi:hypothetical protein
LSMLAVVAVAAMSGLALSGLALSGSASPTSASAATLPHALIESVYATPGALPASGGQVHVVGRVEDATSCRLVLLSRQSFPVVYSHNPTTACAYGSYSAFVTIGANPTAVRRTVAFALVARNGPSSFTGRFYVSLGALLAPSVQSARAAPSALPASGGQVHVVGTVEHATSCQLVLLSRQSFPVVYSHNPTTACGDGRYSALVTIGANPSLVKRTVAFALLARNGRYLFIGRFYIALAALLAPSVQSVQATPSALGPSGGQVHVVGTVEHATSCQLVLLSRQSFPVVYSHNPTTACGAGGYSALVTIGANPSLVKRTVAFALVARNGNYSFIGRFYIALAAATKPGVTTPPPPVTTIPGDAYGAGATGYDVSWPQCAEKGSTMIKALPADPSFAIVGVNNGLINGFNSCFDAEAAWAGNNLSVYIILQPAPGGKPVPYESTGPDASCAPTSSECEGYDWGYNYAEADLAFVKEQGLSPEVWWLDIETAEGWPTSKVFQPVNAAIIQGALAAIRGAGDIAGIYCTWYQWGEITGSYVPSLVLPLWVAGAQNLSGGFYSAQSYCVRATTPGDPSSLGSTSIGFAGGVPWLVQYPYAPSPVPVDPDYSCG